MKIRDYNLTTPALQSEHLDKWHKFSQVTKTGFNVSGVKSTRVLSLTQTTVAVSTAGVVTGVGTDFDGSVSGGSAELQVGDVLVSPTGLQFPVESVASATAAQTVSAVVTAVGAVAGWTVLRSAELSATADVHARTIDTLTIKAHGIPIYNDLPAGFYNAYVPFHYGGPNIQTPEDVGALMVTFGLYPGTYQPSGHINVSRAREFYLNYTSSVISSTNEGTLSVVASAINFLLNLLGEKVRIEKVLASVYYTVCKVLQTTANIILSVVYAKLSNCGKALRASTTTSCSKEYEGSRLIAEPHGKNVEDWVIRSQAL